MYIYIYIYVEREMYDDIIGIICIAAAAGPMVVDRMCQGPPVRGPLFICMVSRCVYPCMPMLS